MTTRRLLVAAAAVAVTALCGFVAWGMFEDIRENGPFGPSA